MKKVFLFMLISVGLSSLNYAQQINRDTIKPGTTANANTDTATQEDYERMLEGQLEVSFRNYAVKNLGLTESEIIAFDPIFREYIDAKKEIIKRKFDVLRSYSKKAAENTTPQDKEDDRGGAIENYWEAEIADMELQKDYFDKLEDVITVEKAFNFFLLEDIIQSRLKEIQLSEVMPMIIEIERAPRGERGSNMSEDTTTNNNDRSQNDQMMNQNDQMINNNQAITNNNQATYNQATTNNNQPNTTTTNPTMNNNNNNNNKMADNTTSNNNNRTAMDRSSINTFDTWFTSRGTMTDKEMADLSHQNIYDGLTQLVAATETLANANNTGASTADMRTKKEKIMRLAEGLRQNPQSLKHPGMAREAFIMTADLLKMVNTGTTANDAVQEVATAARGLQAGQLLTKQTEAVNNFFSKAQQAVNALSTDIEWSK